LVFAREANDFGLLDRTASCFGGGGDHKVGEATSLYFGGALQTFQDFVRQPGFQTGGAATALRWQEEINHSASGRQRSYRPGSAKLAQASARRQ
jgi:hypothetical protein